VLLQVSAQPVSFSILSLAALEKIDAAQSISVRFVRFLIVELKQSADGQADASSPGGFSFPLSPPGANSFETIAYLRLVWPRG
jgi:hypothetical protein